MTEIEKLRAIRTRLVEARRRSADGIVSAAENSRLPAENLAKIQDEIDALDRALKDEEALQTTEAPKRTERA